MLPIFILRVNTTLNCTVTFYFENLLAIGNSSFLTVYLEKIDNICYNKMTSFTFRRV